MSIHRHKNLEETAYYWFAGNNTSGSGADGASPLSHVRLAGAPVDAAPVLSPVPVLLTHGDYPPGAHEIAVPATAVNGFAATNEYGVFSTLAVDSQNPLGFVGSLTLAPIIANVKSIAADAITASAIQADAITAVKVADDVIDLIFAYVVEGTLTFKGVLRIILAAVAGKSTGSGTSNVKFWSFGGLVARISASLDANKNRTAVALDVSDDPVP